MDRLIDIIVAFGDELQAHVASIHFICTNTCSPVLISNYAKFITVKYTYHLHTFLDQLLKFTP